MTVAIMNLAQVLKTQTVTCQLDSLLSCDKIFSGFYYHTSTSSSRVIPIKAAKSPFNKKMKGVPFTAFYHTTIASILLGLI
jgi:hypothetical protein